MNIGVPKERKKDEYRVGLLPRHVKQLGQAGHTVLVETGAGSAAGYDDDQYSQAGARIAQQREVYDASQLIVKVKCPLADEYGFYRPEQVLFTYLHFDENIPPERMQQIMDTGVLGIAYEWVQVGSAFPLLQPMSAVTGILFAWRDSELVMANKGKIVGHYLAAQEPTRAMVIGGGHIGANAVHFFLRNGVQTVIVDKHPETLPDRLRRYIDGSDWERWQQNCEVIHFDQSEPEAGVEAIRQKLPQTDIVICSAVRRPDFPKEKCEFLIDREGVRSMEPNSVITDATACDHDFIETCVSSESLTETQVVEGVIHYSCDHIPSCVPRTASQLLTEATFRYVRLLADGPKEAIQSNEALGGGVMCCKGVLTHQRSAHKKGMAFTELREVL